MDRRRRVAILQAILIVGLVLSTWRLSTVPAGLHSDEVINAYEAHSIAETARDSHGNFLPLFVQAAEDYREGFYVYLLSAFDRVRPLDAIWLKNASVLIFLMSALALYFLTRELTDNDTAALAACAIFVTTPWVFVLSRQLIRPLTVMPFLLAGLALSLRFVRTQAKRDAVLAGVALGLSIHTYLTARLFAPAILGGVVILLVARRKELPGAWRAYALRAVPVFALLALPVAIELIVHREAVLTRMSMVSIFRDDVVRSFIADHGGEPGLWTNIRIFATRYLANISPRYFFVVGDPNYRHSPPGFGQMHDAVGVMALIGLASLAWKRRWRELAIFGIWLVIFPIPAAASESSTGDGPLLGGHAYRTLLGAPWFAILAGLGLAELAAPVRLPRLREAGAARWAPVGVAALLAVWYAADARAWFSHYYNDYNTYTYNFYGYETEKMFPLAMALRRPEEKIYLGSSPVGWMDYYVAYYEKVDPRVFQETMGERHDHSFERLGTPWREYRGLAEDGIIVSKKSMPVEPTAVVFSEDGKHEEYFLYRDLPHARDLRRWKVCGPFPFPEGQLDATHADRDYPAALMAQCDEADNWRPMGLRRDKPYIDLWERLSPDENQFALAKATIREDESELPHTRHYYLGSDDGATMWINGAFVYASDRAGRSYQPQQDYIKAIMDRPENELLLRIVNGAAAWQFGVVELPTGPDAADR
ncbi:MAG: glycosyltransferase family 39 protein [Deltaproteobacteria bacterium]|nr:glycosyltransferase family 39 protein [Deltaproteobacteria bacterium]